MIVKRGKEGKRRQQTLHLDKGKVVVGEVLRKITEGGLPPSQKYRVPSKVFTKWVAATT